MLHDSLAHIVFDRKTKTTAYTLFEAGETNLEQKVLQLVSTIDGKLFYQDNDGAYWRMYVNIQKKHSYDVITPELAYKAGEAF